MFGLHQIEHLSDLPPCLKILNLSDQLGEPHAIALMWIHLLPRSLKTLVFTSHGNLMLDGHNLCVLPRNITDLSLLGHAVRLNSYIGHLFPSNLQSLRLSGVRGIVYPEIEPGFLESLPKSITSLRLDEYVIHHFEQDSLPQLQTLVYNPPNESIDGRYDHSILCCSLPTTLTKFETEIWLHIEKNVISKLPCQLTCLVIPDAEFLENEGDWIDYLPKTLTHVDMRYATGRITQEMLDKLPPGEYPSPRDDGYSSEDC
jgi:hypothetical protein